jgi:hypothetical protein
MTEMDQPTDQQELLKRYLLGNLSESEQDRIEELYFTKDDYLDELLIAEDQLLENYLAGNLTHKEATDFRRNYLSTPEKRLRLQLVQRIHDQANSTIKTPADLTVAQPQVEKNSWWQTVLAFLAPRQPVSRYALALGVLVIVVAAVLLANRNSQLRNQLAIAEQEKSRLQQDQAHLRQLAEQREQKLAEQSEQKDETATSPDQQNESLANRNSQLRNQLAQAEQQKRRLQRDEAQLRQQLAEQRRQNAEIAKSLDQVNEQLANRDSQLRSQLAQAEQEKNRRQEDEAQLRQQLAEQRQRNDEIAKSLDHVNQQRRLLDEELSRQSQTDAALLPSFELGGASQLGSGFGALRSSQPRLKTISIPKQAKLVRFTFNLNPAGFKSYRLSITAGNGTEVWSRSDEFPQPAKGGITLHVPANVLNPGDYAFKLELLDQNGAVGTVAQYPVRVERQ